MTDSRSIIRRYAPRILLLFFTVTAIAAAFCARYLSYRTSLQFFEEAHEPEFLSRDFSPLSDEALLQLGTAHSSANRPISSYQLRPESKPSGTIRIGVFGCSFARGAETRPGGDFPSLLEREFRSTSTHNLEVINFGVGGYGIQQSYLLWQELGEAYDLDYTVFHLFSFHRERDSTFVQLYDAYGPVHARYILNDQNQLELIRVAGRDRSQALELYYRLIPFWRYLRFDIKPPPLLRSLIPQHRQLDGNPFYYFRGEGEIDQIYTLMFEDLIEHSANFIAGANDDRSFSMGNTLPEGDSRFFRMWTPQLSWKMPGFYRAERGHLSALGNKIAAAEYRSLLTGGQKTRVQMASRKGWPEEIEDVNLETTVALDRAKEVYLGIDSEPIGIFVTKREDMPGHTRRFNFRDTETRSLIDISVGSNLMFLPLKDRLTTGTDIEAVVRFADGETQSSVVGSIDARSGVLGRVRLKTTTKDNSRSLKVTLSNGKPQAEVFGDRRVASLRLLLQGTSILHGVPSPSDGSIREGQLFDLISDSTTTVTMRAHPQQNPDVLNGLQSATVSLVVVSEDEPLVRAIPAFQIAVEPVEFPDRHTVLAFPILSQEIPESSQSLTSDSAAGFNSKDPELSPGPPSAS